MNTLSKSMYLLILLFLQIPSIYSQDITILGFYQKQIVLYSEAGDKIDIIDSSKIKKKILATNEEDGLFEIEYADNKTAWIKVSAVKLSQSLRGPCPKEYVSQIEDQNKPASSGWGCVDNE